MDYPAAQKQYGKLKAALTRAKNSKDPRKIIAEVNRAYATFDTWIAYPDHWRLWENAKQDAKQALRR